jgi:hypothetical protein
LVDEARVVHSFDGKDLLQGLLRRPDFRHPISRRDLLVPEVRRLARCAQEPIVGLLLMLTYSFREPLLGFLRGQEAHQQILEDEAQSSLTRALDVAALVKTDEQLRVGREDILDECCALMRYLQELMQKDSDAGRAVIALGKARIREQLARAPSQGIRGLQYLRVAFGETTQTVLDVTLGAARSSTCASALRSAVEQYLEHVLQRTLRWTAF